MIKESHACGVEDALAVFGLGKTAGWTPDVRAMWANRPTGAEVAAGAKALFVGNPGAYAKQVRDGSLFSRKGLIAKGMNPITGNKLTTALNLAGMYGFPAYSMYQAATGPADQRGSGIGAALGNFAGGAAGSPLGFAGQMGGSILGSSLGKALGRPFDRHREQHKTAPDTPRMLAYARGEPSRLPRRRQSSPPISSEMSAVTRRPTEFEG